MEKQEVSVEDLEGTIIGGRVNSSIFINENKK
jgi:hypothetical protein